MRKTAKEWFDRKNLPRHPKYSFILDEWKNWPSNLILPEVGMEGQKRLKAASVLCVDTGGLGSPLLLYLSAAGVGRVVSLDTKAPEINDQLIKSDGPENPFTIHRELGEIMTQYVHVVRVNEELDTAVEKIKEIMAKSTRLGMQTFDQALFDLYEQSIISYEEAMRNADSKNELRLRVKLESKRDSAIADQQSESLRIMEEDTAQTF